MEGNFSIKEDLLNSIRGRQALQETAKCRLGFGNKGAAGNLARASWRSGGGDLRPTSSEGGTGETGLSGKVAVKGQAELAAGEHGPWEGGGTRGEQVQE